MSGAKRMQAMSFAHLPVDVETVAKIKRLAGATQGLPTDETCENLALILLDAALDAALLEFESSNSMNKVEPKDIKFLIATGTSFMRLDISEEMQSSMAKLADAGDYEDGVADLLLETVIPADVLIDAVAMSLIRFQDLSRKQIGQVAAVAAEERLRHSDRSPDQWVVKNVIDKTPGKRKARGDGKVVA